MNIAEQLEKLRATRIELEKKLNTVVEKSMGEGRSMNTGEQEEFDSIKDQIKTLDGDIERFEDLLAIQARSAAPVAPIAADDAGRQAGAVTHQRGAVQVRSSERLEPGIMFARHAMCVFSARGNMREASYIAKERFGAESAIAKALAFCGSQKMESILQANVTKAAVDAATTTDATWAAPLVAYNQYTADFVEFLRPRTIVGRFGQGGIPSLRRIPFNVHIRGATSGGTGYWVGQGKPKPVTAFGFNDVYHGWFKVAGITVATDELIRFSDPAAETLFRDMLVDALVERMDTDFIDPAFAGVANVAPASITNGVTAIPSSGNTAADIRADLNALRASTARAASSLVNQLSQKEFPDLTPQGGSIDGVPVIVSNYVPADSNGSYVVLVDANNIYLSDDGQATVDFSTEASIQMMDNPTNASDPATPAQLVSMFQTDSTAIRAHRFINWSRRRQTAVAVLSGVNWGN
ncbi:MAG: phage major capsid protein [Stenotrophomonas maltophilia]|nr:MAG: phage major capsid protein [Stenotrophomonas maltophilia]